jgi:hypothetical protein
MVQRAGYTVYCTVLLNLIGLKYSQYLQPHLATVNASKNAQERYIVYRYFFDPDSGRKL